MVTLSSCPICLFYPFSERIWLSIRLNNAEKWACDRLTEATDFGKNIIFSDETHFDIGGYVTSKIVAFGAQKTRTHTLKTQRTQNESLFGADCGPEA